MESYINLCDIHDWLRDETPLELIHKLMEYGILPKEYHCKNCGELLELNSDAGAIDKYKWFCHNYVVKRKQKRVRCNYNISLRKDTFFYRSKLEIGVILKFICCWVDNMPLNQIRKNTRVAQHTAVDFANFCREVVYNQMIINSKPIGGAGVHVEIDESKFGRRKYNKGHRVDGQWVFGGYERGTGEIFMVPVDKRDRSTLLPIIKQWILPGSIIHSDFWKAYDCLNDEGYKHLKVNHSIEFVNLENNACTNHIEASWRVAKKQCDTGGRRKAFFAGYLAKYMFLKRCRASNIDPFFEFLRIAGEVYNPKVTSKNVESESSDSSEDEYIDNDII